MFKIINIKENNPECEYAIFLVEKEIEFAKKEGTDVLIIIHGYGSHGVGGKIKIELNKKLQEYKNKNKILDFVSGEQWCEYNDLKKDVCSKYPNLEINSEVACLNPGITIIKIY